VSAGFVVGKEGPMVHTGACIASILGQGGSKKYGLTWSWLRYFKNDRDRRDMITCGAAAGVAAAFRSPVGGVLFALEEAASWYLFMLKLIYLSLSFSTLWYLLNCKLVIIEEKNYSLISNIFVSSNIIIF
jgi:H+/Cl- antiporter ClcA